MPVRNITLVYDTITFAILINFSLCTWEINSILSEGPINVRYQSPNKSFMGQFSERPSLPRAPRERGNVNITLPENLFPTHKQLTSSSFWATPKSCRASISLKKDSMNLIKTKVRSTAGWGPGEKVPLIFHCGLYFNEFCPSLIWSFANSSTWIHRLHTGFDRLEFIAPKFIVP